MGFHAVEVVGRRTKIRKKQHKRRNNTQNNTKTWNRQNRKQKYKTRNKHKKNKWSVRGLSDDDVKEKTRDN